MNLKSIVKRATAPMVAFVCVGVGGLLLLPRDESNDQRLPTLVAASDIADGTDAARVRSRVEVRMLPPEARASGVLSAAEEIPDGVLAYSHESGQQILTSSFAADRIAALGDDFVAVSIRVDSPRWVGPLVITGRIVDLYEVDAEEVRLITTDAVIVDAPDPENLGAKDDAVVVLGVRKDALGAVVLAASNNAIWLVGS
ncbi:MAG: hypothetical protein B7C54_12685 [Acidimicrobiales bacterium mtb01]|nr:hypothetical protein [Actinomycetota bacterium]TEX45882.1 MAG: hypothetical protein B7C54_12685 [Acidimicrobiales bacterium mtb01]